MVVLGEVAVDRGLGVNQRVERTALEAPSGQGGEEGFDGVRPRARDRRELEGPAGGRARRGPLLVGIEAQDFAALADRRCCGP